MFGRMILQVGYVIEVDNVDQNARIKNVRLSRMLMQTMSVRKISCYNLFTSDNVTKCPRRQKRKLSCDDN